MSEFKKVLDCKHYEDCPRRGEPETYCSADLKPTVNTFYNCENYICEVYEHILDVLETEGVLSNSFDLKYISTVDGRQIEVLVFNDNLPDDFKKSIYSKRKRVVIDETGQIYLPTKDDPQLYHPNKLVRGKSLILKKCIKKLKNK